MAERGSAPEISREADLLRIAIPVAPNRWLVGLGFGAALPWLAVFVVGSVVVPVLAPPEYTRMAVLGVIAVNLLFLIVHLLAVMGVWLAFYKLRGTEAAVVTPERFTVERRALGFTNRIRLQRTTYDVVELLDTAAVPGRGPHPRLEVRSGHSAVRFGAGLSDEGAQVVHDALDREFAPLKS